MYAIGGIVLLEMASVEDEALSEASPGTGDPWGGRCGLRQHDRERECGGLLQYLYGDHILRTTSLLQWLLLGHPPVGTGELGNPGVSAVNSGRGKPSVRTKRGCLMTYLRSLTAFNTFRFARAGWENWANWAQLEILLPERSPWTPWLQTVPTVHTLPSDSFQLE